MPETVKDAPAAESKDTKAAEIVADPKKDETIGEALGDKKEAKEVKMVPEAVLIEYKKENKEIHRELKKLQDLIESGGTKKEISADLKTLAEKHDVDPGFLNEFAAAVRKQVEDESDKKVNDRLKPIEEKENADKRDRIFNEHFDKTLADMPEYAKIVNKEVIKTLALDPKNANKTFAQIFEDSYGHLVTGKKTLQPTKPRGGKEDIAIDFAKAATDTEYFKEIMADPELKKKYNENIHERNRF